MTDKEFRRLSRADLIEIIYTLQQTERTLQEENESLRQKLEKRRVKIENAGSLAEALARLNGLFEAAQATADDYVEETKQTREEAEALLEEAQRIRKQADDYLADIKRRAAKLDSLYHAVAQRHAGKNREGIAETDKERVTPTQLVQPSQKQSGGSLNPDAVLQSVKEGCYDDDREG